MAASRYHASGYHSEESHQLSWWWVAALVLLAAIVRLDLLAASDWVIDADEAIVGLMARHMAVGVGDSHGVSGGSWSDIPVFYYGQHYMGSLEPMLVSILFRIFGETNSVVLLKLVPFLFSLALVPLVFLLGRRVYGTNAGLIAAAYIALPPSPLVVWSSMARGGFIEIVLLCCLTLYLAVQWAFPRGLERTLGRGGRSWNSGRQDPFSLGGTALIGILLGLGWWTNNQIVYAILPIGLWFVLQISLSQPWPFGPFMRHFSVGLLSFLIGSLPFWWYNIAHNFVSFEMFSGAKDFSKTASQFGELFTVALPVIFGARRFWHDSDLFPGATVAAWILALLVLGLAIAFGFTRRPRAARFILDPVFLMLVFIFTTGAVFASSSFGWLTNAPRYLLPLYPAIAVLIGGAAGSLLHRSPRTAYTLIALIGALNLGSLYIGGRAIPGQPVVYQGERVAKDHQILIGWLTARRVSVIDTNYWIGYRIAFESDEQIKFRIFGEPKNVRLPSYEDSARSIPLEEIPMVLTPKQGEAVAAALRELGLTFEQTTLGEYTIIYNRKPPSEIRNPVAISQISARSSLRSETVGAVFDGDEETRWGTGQSQRPGQEFTVAFKSPIDLTGITLSWTQYPPDYPRALEIVAYSQVSGAQKGEPRVLVSADQYRRMRILAGQGARLELYVKNPATTAIVLRQVGSDSVFDWSIGELAFFTSTPSDPPPSALPATSSPGKATSGGKR